jgi:hypothetical protein
MRAQPSWEIFFVNRRSKIACRMTLSGEDIGPLAVAFAVEVGLTLLFLFRSGTLPNHPGLAELQKLVSRGRDQVFDTVWVAFGGDEACG